MIIAPVRGKCQVEEELFDENNHLIRDEDGNPMTELVTKEYRSFKPCYVYDISQTSGEPVPSLTETLTGSLESFECLKEALLTVSPVPVVFEKITGGANGYYSPSEKKIVIEESLPQMQMIKTMIHEIGHASLGHGGKEDKWDRRTKELQAESVAFWVCQMLGIDSSDYSFGYISGWSKDKEASDLKENLGIIKETADSLSMAIEDVLSQMAEKDKELSAATRPSEDTRRKSHHR